LRSEIYLLRLYTAIPSALSLLVAFSLTVLLTDYALVQEAIAQQDATAQEDSDESTDSGEPAAESPADRTATEPDEAAEPAEPEPAEPEPAEPEPAEPEPAATPNDTTADDQDAGESQPGLGEPDPGERPEGGNQPSDNSDTELPDLKDDEDVKLVFKFRYAPWKDVLEWFADEADLSLVYETLPPGTFNYTDNHSYKPAEAIDLINSVLLTKGYTLLRHRRMLVLVNLEDGVPPNLVTSVKPEDLDERGDYELVSVLFNVTKMQPEEMEIEISKLLGPQGKVVVLPQAKQIFVTETANRLQTIRDVIGAIENPPAAEDREVRDEAQERDAAERPRGDAAQPDRRRRPSDARVHRRRAPRAPRETRGTERRP